MSSVKLSSILVLCTACSTEGSLGHTGPTDGRTQVALVGATASQDLDLLFVIDDSPGMLEIQQAFIGAFPSFIAALAQLPDGLPNMHIGVISSDMGTTSMLDPLPAPSIGSGAGMCTGTGKNGVLLTSAAVTGSFISDVAGTTGRTTNYTGTLAEAFTSIASLGAAGCGFEQPLHAAETALLDRGENTGFLRPDADLAVILVSNEDDCSVARTTIFGADTSTLGPLQSFRCTRFGVTCEQGGRTTDEMNQIGAKGNCHGNESVAYVTSVREHTAALKTLKADPRRMLFAAISSEASALEVELRTPPGGGTAIPSLRARCGGDPADEENPFNAIAPAVRLTDTAKGFPRARVTAMCNGGMSASLTDVAREVRGLLGDACLTRDIALPADCEAFDTRTDGSRTPLPRCGAGASSDCWQLVGDPGCLGQGQRLRVNRAVPAAPDVMVSLRCTL
jgi:hypothetical protein